MRRSLYRHDTIVDEIYHELTIRAERSQVFEALINQEIIDEWGGGPARVQARIGGGYCLWDGEMYGTIKELETSCLLVHSLRESSWEQKCLDSLVTWQLESVGRGTLIKLSHTGLPNRKIRDLHNEGWCEYFLGPLKVHLEG